MGSRWGDKSGIATQRDAVEQRQVVSHDLKRSLVAWTNAGDASVAEQLVVHHACPRLAEN